MTPEEITELERLCEQASTGPWRFDSARGFIHGPEREMLCDVGPWDDADAVCVQEDGAFIAAARTALPTLLAERREREAKLARFERREMHVCGDPSAACDGDCAHEGWTAIELRKAEAKLARARELLRAVVGEDGRTTGSHAFCSCEACRNAREALTDPPPASRVNADPRRQLEYLSKLVERWVLGELSTEDYHAAVKEIFSKQQETS